MKTEVENASGTIAIYVYRRCRADRHRWLVRGVLHGQARHPGSQVLHGRRDDRARRLSRGLTMFPDHDFAGCPPFAALVVCGGPGWKEQREREAVLEFLRRRETGHGHGVHLHRFPCPCCRRDSRWPSRPLRAAWGLGEETSPLDFLGAAHEAVTPVEARIVDCGEVVTGGGVSLAIDLKSFTSSRSCGGNGEARDRQGDRVRSRMEGEPGRAADRAPGRAFASTVLGIGVTLPRVDIPHNGNR